MTTTPAIATAREQQLALRRSDHTFYGSMAVVMLLTVFVGFAPTYYLKSHFPSVHGPVLRPLVQLHGIAYSLWIILFLVQTTLVSTRRVSLHRRLGIAAMGLAAVMVVFGILISIYMGAEDPSPKPNPNRMLAMAIALGDMVTFAPLVTAAFWMRRKPEVHKRLMLLSYISLLPAPLARFRFLLAGRGFTPNQYYSLVLLLVDVYVLVAIAYEAVTRRRVHAATVWGSVWIVSIQVLRVLVGNTLVWGSFAFSLVKLWRGI